MRCDIYFKTIVEYLCLLILLTTTTVICYTQHDMKQYVKKIFCEAKKCFPFHSNQKILSNPTNQPQSVPIVPIAPIALGIGIGSVACPQHCVGVHKPMHKFIP